MRVIYIAGPYRSSNQDGKSNAWGVQQNVMRAMARSLEVWRRGHAAVCPHANTMFFQDADGCIDGVWLDGDIEILRRCDALLTVEGWERSKGATAEVLLAQQIGRPVLHSLDELDGYLSQPDNVRAVHLLFQNAVAARLRNVMTGTAVEFAVDEGGSAIRIAIDGEAYELEWQEDVVLRRAADYARDQVGQVIQGTVETAAELPCSCSVPDFVGYIREPESYRCLACGLHPSGTDSIRVRLLERHPAQLVIARDKIVELWTKAVRAPTSASMPDVETFARMIVDELRSSMLDLVARARDDGWKAGLEAKHGTV